MQLNSAWGLCFAVSGINVLSSPDMNKEEDHHVSSGHHPVGIKGVNLGVRQVPRGISEARLDSNQISGFYAR